MVGSVSRHDPLPLWAQVSDDLRRRAATGEFAEGFPSEQTLVAQYGVSRHTVREALRGLRADGVVVAARGRASRLVGETSQPLGMLHSLFGSAAARGTDLRYEIVRCEVVEAPQGPPRGELHLDRVRLLDGRRIAFDESRLAMPEASVLLDAPLQTVGIFECLSGAGITVDSAEERVRVATADDPAVADRLGLHVPEPILVVDRTCRAGRRVIEQRRSHLRARAVTVSTTWAHGSSCRWAAELDPGDGNRTNPLL